MSSRDEHYMSLVRKVLQIVMSNPDLFRTPIVHGVFSRYKGKVLLEDLQERTRKVLGHLNMELRSSYYEIQRPNGVQQSSGAHTVVAVRHPTQVPEMYIQNHLVYPASFSRSLAMIFASLGLEQKRCDKLSKDYRDDEDRKLIMVTCQGSALHE